MKNSLLNLWRYMVGAAVLGAVALIAPSAIAQTKVANVNVSQCYACHMPVQGLHANNAHKTVNCVACHSGLDAHAKEAMNVAKRPTTNTDPAACGTCHQDQFKSMFTMDWHKQGRKEKSLATGPAPDPAWTKLMTPHGFTKEHAEPRAHAFMVYDQFVADRSFGGQFQPKAGWKDYARAGGNFKAWDVIEDTGAKRSPGYASAVNPVCMSCKSMDHILDWAYMGDPAPGAKWSRLSNPMEMAKSINHSANCFFCHDPHSAQPRIVRDALIQAVTRPAGDTLYHADDVKATKANLTVKDMGLRGYTRKIAILDKYDTKLQCGQCHVEYNCNPGTDTEKKAGLKMDDPRTNYFPFVNVFDLAKNYNNIHFRDFKHGITGAMLWKAQHPDVETYYGSIHQKAGVECADCHMPKMKNKAGKVYTSHWQTSPREYIKETCLACHTDWNEKQANYVIDAMKNHYYGKVRHAEFWLTRLVDKLEQAEQLGLDAALIHEAQEAQFNAHINWEWWTATNGGYFHNQDQAIKSLNLGMDISQKMIKKLDDAIKAHYQPMKAAEAKK